MALAGCDSAPATSTPGAVVVQPSDLQPTKLSAAERTSFETVCKTSFATFRKRSPPARSSDSDERKADRLCTCFVDQVEDRTNKLQFRISMQILGEYNDQRSSFDGLAAGAAKIGVSAARFQELMQQARITSHAAVKQCLERIADM